MRLSEHFLLLDFLYDQSTTDCVAHCSDLVSDRIDSLKEDSEEIAEGRYLCDTILERIVPKHGPISIAAGLWFSDLLAQGKAHGTGLAPHRWKRNTGAAADIVVHSWTNREKNPKYFHEVLPGSAIEYNRQLGYDGSEFCCLASRSGGNKYRSGDAKWDKLKKSAANEPFRPRRQANWRRKPYTHSHGSALKRNEEYDNRLREAEAIWTEQPAHETDACSAGSVVYGRKPPQGWPPLDHSMVEVSEEAFDDHPEKGRKLLRTWHVRVSGNFVLLDFCRNEKAFERGMVTVPPLTFRIANTVIKVARMFGEVLDPVKEHLGNISVVRGMEPEGFASDPRMQGHRWIAGHGQIHSVEFVTPLNPAPGYLDLLRKSGCEVSASPDPVYGGDRVQVSIRDFTPRRCFTSATKIEYGWTR